MFQSTLIKLTVVFAVLMFGLTEARTLRQADFDQELPSQEFEDIQRVGANFQAKPSIEAANTPIVVDSEQQVASSDAIVPVYVSPYVRSASPLNPVSYDNEPESSYAPISHQAPKATPLPVLSISSKDLKASASYGHHHHGGHHYGYEPSGWLDMGAYTGGKGAFGWYADYPVGGKHHYGGHHY